MEKKGAFLEYNGARLELLETIGLTYIPKRPEHPYCPHLCFETNNMDEVIENLKKKNIEILYGPNEIPDSEKWLYFMDLDLNVLEFIMWIDKDKK